jgi:S1-C subfamily serine protease
MRRLALLLALLAGLSLAAGDSLGTLADSIMKPLVRVSTSAASGSGVLVYSADREGSGEFQTFVLTNHHVVDDAIHVTKKWDSLKQAWVYVEENDQVTVEVFSYMRDGRTVVGQPIKADVVAHNAEEDMALLRLDYPIEIPTVARLFPKDGRLVMLQDVYAVGCSLGVDPIATHGQVTDLEELIDHRSYVMASADIIYGNSGGGVFTVVDGNAYFCGIPSRVRVTRGGQALTHMGYFIPPERLYRFFELQKLGFLYDAKETPTQSFENRAKLQEKTRERAPAPEGERIGPQTQENEDE